MAVDVLINNQPEWNTSAFSIQEDATPLDPDATAAGYGVFSVATNEMPGDKKLMNQSISVSDGAQGITQGFINQISGDGEALTISATGEISLLHTVVSADPFNGTLGAAFTYYLGLVGITTNFAVDATIISRAVILPGFNDDLWARLNQLCSGLGVEIGYVSDTIYLRPIRANVAQNYRDSTEVWTLDNTNIVQEVNVLYYNPVWTSGGNVFPVGGDVFNAQIQQVDAGQQITVNVDLTPTSSDGTGAGVSVSTIIQPGCVDNVTATDLSSSQYCVIDQNNNPYPSATWNKLGGKITVAIGADNASLVVTITGASDPTLGPFRIAGTYAPVMNAVAGAAGTYYSSLRLIGTGVFYNKQLLTIPTGNTAAQTSTVSGATVDNFAIQTLGDATSAALNMLADASGPTQTLSVTTVGINTVGDPLGLSFISLAQWDAQYGGQTFAAGIDAAINGMTFAKVDALFETLNPNPYANQAFGNVAGTRVRNDDAYYRITSATISATSVQYAAHMDTTIGDWDAVFGNHPISYWDGIWNGNMFSEYSPTPLSVLG